MRSHTRLGRSRKSTSHFVAIPLTDENGMYILVPDRPAWK